MAKSISEVNKFYIEHHKDKKTVEELAKETKLTVKSVQKYLESLSKVSLLLENGTVSMTGSQSLKDSEEKAKSGISQEYLKFKVDQTKPVQ